MSPRARDWSICFLLLAATFLIYARVAAFDFVNFDDDTYVRDNPHVRAGLTPSTVAWAFISRDEANWFPLTRLSHLLDVQLFGLRPGAHHLVNVLWHALAALLLFAFLRSATGRRWPSLFVSLPFALHPLHVESVAWISERKDVLSAFFWFLALWSYVRYARAADAGRPGAAAYIGALGAFAAGLMAKPMIVTLPCVLLLLDAWPLGRLGKRPPTLLISEKLPFFVLSAISAAVTWLVQRSGGAMESLDRVPLGLRVENALWSYVVYLRQALWPSGLAVFYPHPARLPLWQPAVGALLLAGVSLWASRTFRSRPYLATGWFWYVGTLVPVIGLVQVGSQARADRYMYVPMVGLGIMAAWGATDMLRRRPKAAPLVGASAALLCATWALLSWQRLGYWRNSVALFERALAVTRQNYLAHYNLGVAFSEIPSRRADAIAQFQAALRIKPEYPAAHNNLGNLLARLPGRLPEAIAQYREAIRLDPAYAAAHVNLGSALEDLPGGLPESISEYQATLRLNPLDPAAHNDLGDALLKMNRLPEAIAEFEAALRLDPDYAGAHGNLGIALSHAPGRLPEAIAHFEAAARLRPADAAAHVNLGSALARLDGRLPDAISEYREAVRLAPDSPVAHLNLGNALSRLPGGLSEAVAECDTAVRLRPDSSEAHYALGLALAKTPGRLPEAMSHLETSLRLKPNPALAQALARLRAGGAPGSGR
jgi:tetratricopeptide (TPR) repeat protein